MVIIYISARRKPFNFNLFTGHVDVAKVLIEKGAEVNAKNSDEWTPLQLASQNGSCPSFYFLNKNILSILDLFTIQVMWRSLNFLLKMVPTFT